MPEDQPGPIDRLCTDAVRESPASPYDAWREASTTHPEAVQLGVGFPFTDSFPTDELAAATDRVLSEEPEALQYGGCEMAKKPPRAIADHVSRPGFNVDPEEILVTDSATRGIDSVCGAFLDPGRMVFTVEPTFPGSLTVFRDHGAEIVGCPLDRRGLDIKALESELDRGERADEALPTLLYTIPTFHNLTGTSLPRERRERLLDLASTYDFAIV